MFLDERAAPCQTKKNKASSAPPTVRVRYEQTQALYASQFMVHANQEEVIVNFSAGYITDPQTQDNVLPVHTRLALSPAGTARLIDTLRKALDGVDRSKTTPRPAEASLPKLN